MIPAALTSALHVFALAVGLPGIFLRARWPGQVQTDPAALKRTFAADNAWGIAALLWISTGLVRAFGPWEKTSAYYLHSGAFWLKMTLFLVILALEVWPMVVLIRWRVRQGKNQPLDLSPAPRMQLLSRIELGVLVLMPFVAAGMARGLWFGWPV